MKEIDVKGLSEIPASILHDCVATDVFYRLETDNGSCVLMSYLDWKFIKDLYNYVTGRSKVRPY